MRVRWLMTEITFHVFRDARREGRFTIVADNHEPVAQSEGYVNGEGAAVDTVEMIIDVIRHGDVYIERDGVKRLIL